MLVNQLFQIVYTQWERFKKKAKWVSHALSELATQNRNRNTSDKVKNNDIEVTNTESDKEEEIKDGIKMEYIFKNHTVDTEVIEGLQLSVECAREKEEPSIESENKDDVKRLETFFIKAEPYKSELECNLSERKNLDSQEANTSKTTLAKKKKRGSQTNWDTLKFNESDDSQDNCDEKYSPRIKKMKLSTLKDSTKRFRKKKSMSDDENLEVTSTSGKIKKEIKVKTEEALSKKTSSARETESIVIYNFGANKNNFVDKNTLVKGKRKRYSNVRPKDNSKIQNLKKYIKAAGIRIKCYNSLWADCKTNIGKINRLKKLLEDNGVTGRPTLEKCKLVKQKRERMQEVSELDTSNIISEGHYHRKRSLLY